ncbi:hypothetical protein CCR94_19235 [Rhodoblastus sphagnicola]|uniref:Gas vesicle protein n=1 Tax=Rhodoblastus sphagnicola TaxID=333368 RepID=A0A2S6MZM3_9HYPH|nr:gas vesicle protein [Rhodoblastus sphagnicola]MBB4200726.1 hypothetical protein [Rhodoblastus sphagnicola]PPQ27800.1 hypothetical protein CCR94_19235 [Rhodoblastus sphagnicola]
MPEKLDYVDDIDESETLVDLLDRVLDVGVVIVGDLRISVANVELLYLGLKLVLGSVDKIAGLSPARAILPETRGPLA